MTLFTDTKSLFADILHSSKKSTMQENFKKVSQIFHNDDLTQKELQELAGYQEYLDIFRKDKKKEDLFFNSTKLDASLLMSNLLSSTVNQITMVVGRFDGAISEKGSYCLELEKCLNNGVQIDVLILDKVNNKSKAFNLLLEARKSNKMVQLFSGTEKTKTKLRELFSQYNGNVHFATFDDNKYRLEIEPSHYASIASFNAPKAVKRLKEMFNELLLTAQKFK